MRYRVVLIDDDQRFMEALSVWLLTDGRFEIAGTAANGREGVEVVAREQPDVVLMDIDMPVMDGVEASRRIHDAHPEVPIVIVSASQFEERARSLRAPRTGKR